LDGRFRIASITKPFTSVLAVRLAQAGRLRLEAPLSEYLPEYRKDIGARVTVQHLLNHTSGIPDFANLPGFWLEELPKPHTTDELLKNWLSRDLQFEPGSRGTYNSTGFFLLGLIIERVTGKPYGEALREWVLAPAGMRESGYDEPGPLVPQRVPGFVRGPFGLRRPPYGHMPNVYSSGGMYSTAMDLWRFDRALAGDALLSPEWKRRMFTGYANDDFGKVLQFGLGWYVGQRELAPGRRVAVHEHGGNTPGFRSLVVRMPEEGHFLALLMNEGDGSYNKVSQRISNGVMRVLFDLPVELPKASLGHRLSESLRAVGVEGTRAALPGLREQSPPADGPNELNNLGYAYLQAGRIPEALFLLRLNIALFPEDANSYDSLGEICLAAKDLACAKENYERALSMDPRNDNARKVLEGLKAPPPKAP
jgi:CubicO group peptidase (beta-lactamase class C family)